MVKIDIRSSVRSVAIVMLCAAAAGTVSAAGTQEAAQPAERMTIELQGGYKMEGQDTGWFEETVEERYNVEIVWNNVPKGGTQMETHLATGKFFDAGFVWKSPKELYYNALTRGIPEEMVVEHMPNYTKIFREQNPIAWRMNRNPEDPSEFLSLAGMNANNGLPRLLPAFRLHWATAVGVEVPGYAPENIMVLSEEKRVHFLNHDLTFAWFEEMLYAFRDGDPDGNGKADTIPWGANNRSRWSFGGLMGAFDIGAFAVGGGTRYNSLVDGELLAWAVAPGYRQFLKKMAAWYRDGILDNEFTNINNNQMGEKLCAGTLAAATVVADDAASSEGQLSSRPPDCITAEADLGMDGAATIVTKPLVGPDGSQGAVHYDTSGSGGLRVAGFIGAHVTDERLPRILEVLDYVHYSVDDPRVYVHRDFGQPGTHFEWKGEEYESQVTIYPPDGSRQRRPVSAQLEQRQVPVLFQVRAARGGREVLGLHVVRRRRPGVLLVSLPVGPSGGDPGGRDGDQARHGGEHAGGGVLLQGDHRSARRRCRVGRLCAAVARPRRCRDHGGAGEGRRSSPASRRATSGIEAPG